jgi:hypothetical protein
MVVGMNGTVLYLGRIVVNLSLQEMGWAAGSLVLAS